MTHLNKWQFKITLNAKASNNRDLISKIHLHTLAQRLVYRILNKTSEHLKQMFHLNPISNLMIKVINSQVIVTFDTDFLLTYQQTDQIKEVIQKFDDLELVKVNIDFQVAETM